MLAGVLVPLTLALFAAGAYRPEASPCALERTRRGALALGGLFVAFWSAAGAELLSLGQHLSYGAALAWWAAPCVALGAWALERRFALRRWWGVVPARPDGRTLALLVPTLAVLAFTLVVALATPPTTWDSISYHLPRQIYWLQQHGVQHYPASDLRQLELPPLAEFIGAQLMLLFRGDGSANMVQWCSFALAIATASLIAAELGAPAPGQAFAALMVACLPSAATQAVNAKNDLVVAFFLLTLVWLGVVIWKTRRITPGTGVLIGAAGGLLALAKGTGYLYSIPAGAFIAWAALRASPRRAIPAGVLAACIAATINTGHWARNYHFFQNPIALPKERGGFNLSNRTHTPAALASNLIRTASLQMGTPWEGWNRGVERAVLRLHDAMGISASDERTSAQPKHGFDVVDQTFSDGNNAAPVHSLLVLAMIGAVVAAPRRLRRVEAWPVHLLVPALFGAFCIVLAWQVWNNRLLIPVFALVGPAAAGLRATRLMNILRAPAAAACAVLVWPALLYNPAKPMLGPGSIWKVGARARVSVAEAGWGARQRQAVDLIRSVGARSVGLQMGWVTSYPLLRELYWETTPRPKIVLTQPNYLPPEPDTPEPGAGEAPDVVVVWPDAVKMDMALRGFVYRPVLGERGFIVYRRDEATPGDAGAPLFGGWDRVSVLLALEPASKRLQFPARRQARVAPVVAEFTGDGSERDLVVEVRGDGRPGQAVAVVLNGEELARIALGYPRDVSYGRVRLPARAGPNALELREVPPRADLHRIAYQRIAIVPGAAGDVPGSRPSGPEHRP